MTDTKTHTMRVLNHRNVHRRLQNMVYIGRDPNSDMHFGNPFSHLSFTLAAVKVKTRQEAVDAYRAWLAGTAYQDVEPERREWILNNLSLLIGKDLVCWCKPKVCHGDVLVDMVTHLGATRCEQAEERELYWEKTHNVTN